MKLAVETSASATLSEQESIPLNSNISCPSVNQSDINEEEDLTLPPEAVLDTLKEMLTDENEHKKIHTFFAIHQAKLSLENLQDLMTVFESKKKFADVSTINSVHEIIKQAIHAKTQGNPQANTEQNTLPNNPQKRRLSPEATSSSAQKPHRDPVEQTESFTESAQFEIAAKLYATAWSTWDEATKIPHEKNTLYKLARSQYKNYRDLLCSWPQSAQQAFIKKHYQIFNLFSADHLDTKTKKRGVEQFIRTFIQGQIDLIKKNEPKKKPLTAKPNTLFSQAEGKDTVEQNTAQQHSQRRSLR